MAEFKVGGKVICVKDHPTNDPSIPAIFKGQIRTVRSLFTSPYNGSLLLRFEEFVGPINPYTNNERGYEAFCFLPLDDFKEISFTKINEEVPVSAQ